MSVLLKVSGDIGTTNYYQNLVEILKLTKLSGDVSAKKKLIEIIVTVSFQFKVRRVGKLFLFTLLYKPLVKKIQLTIQELCKLLVRIRSTSSTPFSH